MRILYASEATGWTGGANQVWLVSQELNRRGHQVAVACPGQGELFRRLRAASVETIPLAIRQDYDLIGAHRLFRIARSWKPDLLHAHHPRAHAVSLLTGYLAPKLPLVVTRRVIFPIKKNPFSRFKYSNRRISRYIAVCDAAAQELSAAGVAAERISVIPSAVQLDRWEAARELRAGLRWERPYQIAMVGHYSPFKGHHILLDAARRILGRFPDTVFRFVGRDTRELAAVAKKLGVSSQVEFLGERFDVPEILSRAHVYAMPSLSEGIGTALIEAQAAMVPVVASDVGGLPQVVENGKTGLLVPPGDAASLADAIVGLLEHPKEAEAMALAGYHRVRERFCLASVADRLEDLYRSLLS